MLENAVAPPHVLVIDDDQDIRQIVELAMKFEGIAVETAENGVVALERLRTGDLPSLILLDLMMPVMDGWAFSEIITRDPRLSKIPVVIMTAFESFSRPPPPSVEVLRKPMSLGTLKSSLRKYYEK